MAQRFGQPSRRALTLCALSSLLLIPTAFATQHASPEERTMAIARSLRPIPDEEWQNIAGDRALEGYAIIKGDTLYDVSQRLFGDPKYWPKIWAINNRTIVNPHLIFPGNSISFTPGSGSALPAVAVTAQNATNGETPEGAPTQSDYHPSVLGRSQEWRYLPRQSWETEVQTLPPGVDQMGFDLNSKIRFNAPTLTELPSVASTERLEFKGQIFASITERQYLFVGDTVYIQTDQRLSPGEIYAITKEPTPLTAAHSDRPGFSYPILGKVKILAMRDKLYMAEVKALNSVVSRGVSLMPFPEHVPEPALIPAEKALEGTLLLDEEITGSAHATQHRWVYVDRGTDDGIKAGMIFRQYEHKDAVTGATITDADVIPLADIEVIFATQHYSTARVMRGDRLIENGTAVVALTSLDDLKHFESIKAKDLFGNNPPTPEPVAPPPPAEPKASAAPADLPKESTEPPPADISSSAEAPNADQPAPVEKAAPPAEAAPPPPFESAPPPAAAEPAPLPPPTEAPPPTENKAFGNGGGEPSLPPPPEVTAPLPDL